jgi:hypothetical protein
VRARVALPPLFVCDTVCMYVFQPVPELQKIISEAELRGEEECYALSTKHEPRDA